MTGTRPSERPETGPEPEWKRRRRLAAVFGEVLPETTGDERDPEGGDRVDCPAPGTDAWLQEQVPPHHG